MKNMTVHEGTLIELNRLKNSINGNPRYQAAIHEDGGVILAFTKPDCSLGYTIKNHLNKRVRVSIGTHYGQPHIDALWAT